MTSIGIFINAEERDTFVRDGQLTIQKQFETPMIYGSRVSLCGPDFADEATIADATQIPQSREVSVLFVKA